MKPQNDAELMRSMISLLEHSATAPSTTMDPLDEDLGLMRRVGTRLKGMFSKQQKGVSDVLRGAAPLLKQFERFMGRKNQTFENLTWQTVITFMASNAATTIPVGSKRGVPFNMTQLGEVLDDPTFRNSMVKQLNTEKVQVGSFNTWFPTSTTLASKKTQLVGGPTPTNRTRRTEVIINSLMEAVVSKMFDLVDAAVAPEPQAAPTLARTPAPGTGPGPGGGPSPTPTPTPTPTPFTPADIAGLQNLLALLRGRPTP